MIILNWIWDPSTVAFKMIGVMIQNIQKFWVYSIGQTIQDYLMRIFRAFYLQLPEINLHFISDTVISVTTQLNLLYASIALHLLRSWVELGSNLFESMRLKIDPKSLVRLKLHSKNALQITRIISIMKILASIIIIWRKVSTSLHHLASLKLSHPPLLI